MKLPWLALIESTMTGTGRLFARKALELGFRPILLTANPARYKYVKEDGLDVLQIDTQDEQAMLNACQQLATDPMLAGITSSSEYYYGAAASLHNSLDFLVPIPKRFENAVTSGINEDTFRQGELVYQDFI
jgi:S-sulfo-L-cysteine synthase (3-phospho-L-serine-dependent)